MGRPRHEHVLVRLDPVHLDVADAELVRLLRGQPLREPPGQPRSSPVEADRVVEAEGVSGAGLVKVRLNGKGGLNAISIDPSLLREGEGEILEDLIVAAHNDAKIKVEAVMAEKTKALTAGLPLPPGMKLPF